MSKPTTITLTAEIQRMLPLRVRRKSGFKAGDVVEVKAIGGVVTLISKVPPARDEYTPEQRRIIDARLAKADEDIKAGRLYGPFDSVDDLERSLRETAKAVREKAKTKRSSRR